LEAVIEQTLTDIENGYIKVGMMLKRIRDEQLYPPAYPTFEEYCEKRWSQTRQRAYQLMGAADVFRNLSTRVDTPKTEAQARELTCLTPEHQCAVAARMDAMARQIRTEVKRESR
jgi:hypothetical protein